MKFINNTKYIYEELEQRYTKDEWREKQVVIFGFVVKSMVIIQYFLKNRPCYFAVVDNNKTGQEWAGITIEKPSKVIPNLSENSVIIVPSRNSSIPQEILMYQPEFKDNILVLDDIEMENFPSIILPIGTEKIGLREVQSALLALLEHFHEFCIANHLQYFLDSGTLLGAVRHKGFIPWDDDLDVVMPLPDYIRFCEIYPQNGQYFFESIFNQELRDLPISVLTKLKLREIVTEFHHYPIKAITGIGMDIIPLCGFPETELEQQEFMKRFITYGDIWKEKVVIPYGTKNYSRTQHVKLYEEMMKMLFEYDYDHSEYIGPAYFGLYEACGAKNRAMPRTAYEKAVNCEFEKYNFFIPVNYDVSLSRWYGDYMKLPPKEKRIPHCGNGAYKLPVKEVNEYYE